VSGSGLAAEFAETAAAVPGGTSARSASSVVNEALSEARSAGEPIPAARRRSAAAPPPDGHVTPLIS
jgi:hypothetical protein